MTKPDRRVLKTRKAIYQAFLDLLNDKGYEAITVQDIIDLADVGRSTFYAHYESKESLLNQLCQELFHHFFEAHPTIDTRSYLAHLLSHFRKNQDRIASLLLSNNPYFIRMLRAELEHDVYPMIARSYLPKAEQVPESYRKHFVTSHFIASVSWWLSQRDPISETELVDYFLVMLGAPLSVKPL